MQCQFCKEDIHAEATVCPHCTRKQKRGGIDRFTVLMIVCAAIGFVFFLAANSDNTDAKCRRAVALNPSVTHDQCVALVEKNGDRALNLIAPGMGD
jgi:hypothetical protein